MIRLTLLNLLILALLLVAVRRWYWALCGLLFMTVLTQHPSMPTRMLGIQGLNPWNVTLIVVAYFWLVNRRGEPAVRATPLPLAALFGAYVVMVIATTLTGVFSEQTLRWTQIERSTTVWLLTDGMINPLKYLLVGVMFFDGARDRQRIRLGLLAAVASSLCYAALMFKSMRERVFTIDYSDARRMTDKLIGLFANDVAELLAFAIWASVFVVALFPRPWQRWLWIAGTALCLPPFIALKSRAGFLAFAVIGLVLGTARWRRLLLACPFVLALLLAVPSVRERVTSGFTEQGPDWNEVSAGRLTNIWPPVIRQIGEAPVLGHGRYAILREDCYREILQNERVLPTHPHSSYLEILLDAGLVGLAICLALMAVIIHAAVSLMRMRADRLLSTAGTVALIAALAELTAGVAGSSFFATQSAAPYLAVWGIALRAQIELSPRRAAPEGWRARLATAPRLRPAGAAPVGGLR